MTAPTLTPARSNCHSTPRTTTSERATTPPRAMVYPTPKGSSPVEGTTPPQPRRGTTPTADSAAGAQAPTSPARTCSTPNDVPPVMSDPMLALLADVLDDLERTRMANQNRLRQLLRDETDSDGVDRGFGLTLDNPQAAAIASLVDGIAAMEHQAVLTLQRGLRQHPLGPWMKATQGIGEKQGARLLASIGDPYWNTLHDRPRTVSELWAFSGYHVLRGSDTNQTCPETQMARAGVAPSRTKGQRSNWSSDAKMRTFLVAESCMKNRNSPYRATYDEARAKYAAALHGVECRRCGPKGKPAPVGSPLSDGHKNARALRAISKAVLRDLWRESKRLHDLQEMTA